MRSIRSVSISFLPDGDPYSWQTISMRFLPKETTILFPRLQGFTMHLAKLLTLLVSAQKAQMFHENSELMFNHKIQCKATAVDGIEGVRLRKLLSVFSLDNIKFFFFTRRNLKLNSNTLFKGVYNSSRGLAVIKTKLDKYDGEQPMKGAIGSSMHSEKRQSI